MAYDTIKLRSPFMDLSIMRRIEQQCILRSLLAWVLLIAVFALGLAFAGWLHG